MSKFFAGGFHKKNIRTWGGDLIFLKRVGFNHRCCEYSVVGGWGFPMPPLLETCKAKHGWNVWLYRCNELILRYIEHSQKRSRSGSVLL